MRRQPAAASCPPCISPLQYETDDRASCSGCTCRIVLDNARSSCTPLRLRRASSFLLIVNETPRASRNSVPVPSRDLRGILFAEADRSTGRGIAIANPFFFLFFVRSLDRRRVPRFIKACTRARVASRWTHAGRVIAGEKNCDTPRRVLLDYKK